jgi:hypothetical protein
VSDSILCAVLLMLLTCAAVNDFVAADEPRVTAVRLDGSEATGRLESFDGRTFRILNERAPDRRSEIPLIDVLSLEIEPATEATVAAPVLEFANGDRIHAEIAESSDDQLVVRWHDAELTVPLEVLRGVIFRPLDPNDGAYELLLRERGANDVVLLSNGDRLAGQFLGLGATDLTIDVEGREVLAPRDRIAAIFFSPELTIQSVVPGIREIVHDATGWLTVEGLTHEKSGSWTGKTAFGSDVVWPAGAVRRMQVFGNRVVPLTALQPKVEFTPYLERRWPIRIHRTVNGEPLSIDDQTYAVGVGVHSRCRLKYDLRKQFDSFHAVAGLASSSGDLGSVEFAVELDGREVIRTSPVGRASEPLGIVNLDVRNVETMILTVDFGRNGDVLDRANWCDAVLVRTATASE